MSLKLTCGGCKRELPAASVNCPSCVQILTPEHARLKEAHTCAALESAIRAAGIEDEPASVTVIEQDAKGRNVLRTVDNTKDRRAAAHARRSLEEGFLRGAEGAPRIHRGASQDAREAHVVNGDSEAQAATIKAALAARSARLADERCSRVIALRDTLATNPANLAELVRKADALELADALKELGIGPGSGGAS